MMIGDAVAAGADAVVVANLAAAAQLLLTWRCRQAQQRDCSADSIRQFLTRTFDSGLRRQPGKRLDVIVT